MRTLHHYDEIGLLLPSGRSAAGYRLYAARDLERLRQILYRELGFPLEEIVDILAANGDAAAHLRRQRQMLADRITRLQAMVHNGLGEMYVAAPRFTAHYEAVAAGLARYIRDAIAANVARLPTAGAAAPPGSGGVQRTS